MPQGTTTISGVWVLGCAGALVLAAAALTSYAGYLVVRLYPAKDGE